MSHDLLVQMAYWPVENAVVDLPIKMKGNLKCSSSILLSPLGAQNKDIRAALQSLLGSLHNGYKNVNQKVNLCCLKLNRAYSMSFNSSNVGKFFWS